MFNNIGTIGELKEAVLKWEEILGPDTPVCLRQAGETHCLDPGGILLDWIYIDPVLSIKVGSEGDDYKPEKGEISALLIT